MNYLELLSGTDVRGVAAVGVSGQEINLTDEVCKNIAVSFALWLSYKTKKDVSCLKIAVGHDSRISADRISNAVNTSLSEIGSEVLFTGLSSTPAMFMITKSRFCDTPADGAIQITASHHPFNRNGLKFFTPGGGLDSADVRQILTAAQSLEIHKADKKGAVTNIDFMSRYAEILRKKIKKEVNSSDYGNPLSGFKIVVDAGNGAGGFYAFDVLEKLGADISGSQFLEPDGRFPNHIPNPEDKTAMEFIVSATEQSNADLGVIFDTDVDRAGCVTIQNGKGKELNRNRLVALAAALAVEVCPGGTVVTDSITSDGLKDFIENTLKAKHHRFKRGYKNVINESLRLNAKGEKSPLAIETSGHAAFQDNFFLDDGAYLITKIIIKMAQLKKEGKTLDDLLSALKEPLESIEMRYTLTGEKWKEYGEQVLETLKSFTAEHKSWVPSADNFEGYRVSIPEAQGWFLLRMSVHDPVMPLNIESDIAGGSDIIKELLNPFFEKFSELR